MSLDHVEARKGVSRSRVGKGQKAWNENLSSFEAFIEGEGSLEVDVAHQSEQHFLSTLVYTTCNRTSQKSMPCKTPREAVRRNTKQ